MSEGNNTKIIKGGIASAVIAGSIALINGLDLFSNASSLFSGPPEPVQLNVTVKVDGATGRVQVARGNTEITDVSAPDVSPRQKEVGLPQSATQTVADSIPVAQSAPVTRPISSPVSRAPASSSPTVKTPPSIPDPKPVEVINAQPQVQAAPTRMAGVTTGGYKSLQELKTEGPVINVSLLENGSNAIIEKRRGKNLDVSPEDLLDGNENTYWTLGAHQLPLNMIVALNPTGAWMVDTVVINTPSGQDTRDLMRDIEVSSSLTYDKGWKKIHSFTVKQDAGAQYFEIPPTASRFVRFQFKSNWGGRKAVVGNLEIQGRKIIDPTGSL